jgi:putative peptidoglycan lipid II flippase
VDEPGPTSGSSVLRSSAQISGITLLARIAGFARWIVLGFAVGTTYLGNVYQSANLIPNVVFELLAGGMLASIVVPTFVGEMAAGRERVNELASTLANALLLVSIPLVVAGVVFAEPLFRVLLAGAPDAVREQQVQLGAWFLRFFLPQVPLYLLGILMQGLLHAHRRFVWPALGPLLSSLTVIATYLVFRAMGTDASLDDRGLQMYVLAGGTTMGVFVLTFCQLPSLLRIGIRWRPRLDHRDPVVRKAVRAGLWGAVFVGLLQLMLLVVVALANRVEGGVVAFQIANAFFELPNAIVGLPVAIALFPALSEAFVRRDERQYARLLTDGWRLASFVALPAGVALYFIAPVASETLLGWSDIADPALVAATLRGLAIGVPPWVLMATIVRGFYARGATSRPALLNGLALGVVALVGIGGSIAWDSRGTDAMRLLGSSVGLGWWVAAIAGVLLLSRAARAWSLGSAVRSLLASAARAVVVGAAVWAAVRAVGEDEPVLALAAALGAGVVVAVVLGARSPELRKTLALAGRGMQTQTDS